MLRSRAENLPIIATAGSPIHADIRCLDALNAIFLRKPYELKALVEITERLLGSANDSETEDGAEAEAEAEQAQEEAIVKATLALTPQLRALAQHALREGAVFPSWMNGPWACNSS